MALTVHNKNVCRFPLWDLPTYRTSVSPYCLVFGRLKKKVTHQEYPETRSNNINNNNRSSADMHRNTSNNVF